MNTIMRYLAYTTVTVAAVFFACSGVAEAATTLNTNNTTCAVLSVSTTSKQVSPGQPCWGTTGTIAVDDEVTLRISYENTGNETAENVRLRMEPNVTEAGTAHSFTATLRADNAPLRSGNVTIYTNALARLATVNEIRWFPNNGGSAFGIPFGQTGNSVFSSEGLLLGDIPTGESNRGSVLVVFKAYDPNNSNLPGGTSVTPVVGTSPVTAVTQSSASLSGYLDPKGKQAYSFFRYGRTTSLSETTAFVDRGTTASFVEQGISNLLPGVRYYARHCARVAGNDTCGVTVSFVTRSTVANDSSDTSDNSDADTDDPAIEYFEIFVPIPSTFLTLGIQNGVSAMQTGDIITYEVTYKNTSNRTLRDGVLYVELPKDLVFLDATRGDYSSVDHAISYEFGVIGVKESGTIFVTMQLPAHEDARVPVIAMAKLVHQNPDNGAREGATAYDVDTRYHTLNEERQEALAASVFGSMRGGGTLIAVLLSLLGITALVHYLQLSGYIRPATTKIVREPVLVPQEAAVMNAPENPVIEPLSPIEREEPPHPPAHLDDVYQSHLGH